MIQRKKDCPLRQWLPGFILPGGGIEVLLKYGDPFNGQAPTEILGYWLSLHDVISGLPFVR
jgi:hypothetical protein